jgi:hypothetical protein
MERTWELTKAASMAVRWLWCSRRRRHDEVFIGGRSLEKGSR